MGWVLRDPVEEGEDNDDTTASTTSTSSTEDEGSSIDDNSATKKQTPTLPRQTATRHLIVKESDARNSVIDVSVFKKKQQSTKSKALQKKTAMPMMMQAAMQAIVEDENEDAQTANTATSTNTTEITRLKEISTLAR